jgi:polar amino acid transport system substrate-binding protein
LKFAYLIEPPFNYRDADGTVTGCDVELARYVLEELGEPFEPVEADFAELLPGLGQSRWQMTTGLFATEERKRYALFSRPIWALPDGLLVAKGNPLGLVGYRSAAAKGIRVAAIRGQVQHQAALDFGVGADRLQIFDTYEQAADAVATGAVDAYASVARAHTGFLAQHPELSLDVVSVPASEKLPARGSFGFARHDEALCRSVGAILERFIGTPEHRALMARFGFDDSEIDLLLT